MKSRVSIRHAMGPKFLLLYEREREREGISPRQQFTGRICRARAFTTAKWLARSRFRLISVALPDVSSSATRYEENRSSIPEPVSPSIPGGRGVYGPLKPPDTPNFSPSASLLLSIFFWLSGESVVQRRPYWRSDLEGIKNLPRDASRLEAVSPPRFDRSVPLARTRLPSTSSISHFLLSLLIAFILSLFPSLSLSLIFRIPSIPPRFPSSLRRIFSLRWSVRFRFSRSDLASSTSPSILRITRVSRNLILWTSLRLSQTLVPRPFRTGLYLSSSDLVEGFRPVRSGIMSSLSLSPPLLVRSCSVCLSFSRVRDIGPDTGGTWLHIRKGPGVGRVISISPQ